MSMALTGAAHATTPECQKIQNMYDDPVVMYQPELLINEGVNNNCWRTLRDIGDYYLNEHAFEKARDIYVFSITALKIAAPQTGAEAHFNRLSAKLNEAQMLAPTYRSLFGQQVETRTRGLLTMRSIGVSSAVSVATPITFDYGKDSFDHLGQFAADDLLGFLKGKGYPKITITGHTDPDGSDADNMDLSNRRAVAVERYLLENTAYPSQKIITKAKGEHELYQTENRDRYTTEQYHQLCRRVEITFH